MRNRKWLSTILAIGLLSLGLLAGCGGNKEGNTASNSPLASAATAESAAPAESASPSAATKDAMPVKLKLAMWETKVDIDFWTEKVKEYTKLKPNVTVEVETIPDNSGQYLKVRLAAKDLPDVFMMKPAHLPIYKDSLLPLDDLAATGRNKFTVQGQMDGHVLGLPMVSFSEYVYYHPSIFQEVGIEIPQTLDEFVAALDKLKKNGKYIPIAIGGKDDWTFYPFTEFGPNILSKDEQYLANLVKHEEPFGAGSTFDQVLKLVQKMSKEKYAGDALGISFDQSEQLFQSKKAAMIALGQWYYADHMSKVKNDDDLDAFALPWRQTTDEPLTSMTMTDQFFGIDKETKYPNEAKAFLEWMFSKDVYQNFINTKQNSSTMNDVNANLPFFEKVNSAHPFTPFLYYGSDEKYIKAKAAAQFDEKHLAAEIYAGQSVENTEKKLNSSWKKVVSTLQ